MDREDACSHPADGPLLFEHRFVSAEDMCKAADGHACMSNLKLGNYFSLSNLSTLGHDIQANSTEIGYSAGILEDWASISLSDYRGQGHLIVCVHGLSGNLHDLRLLKLHLLALYPELIFLMSSCNQVSPAASRHMPSLMLQVLPLPRTTRTQALKPCHLGSSKK